MQQQWPLGLITNLIAIFEILITTVLRRTATKQQLILTKFLCIMYRSQYFLNFLTEVDQFENTLW